MRNWKPLRLNLCWDYLNIEWKIHFKCSGTRSIESKCAKQFLLAGLDGIIMDSPKLVFLLTQSSSEPAIAMSKK